MRRRAGRSGSRRFSVPDLNGLTRSQAIAAIQAAGFTYLESQQETTNSGLNLFIGGQSVSAGTVIPLGSTIPFVYYNYVEAAPVITYGPCESYGSGTNVGSGTQCNGTYTETYIDYSYNTRKKIYSNGAWNGSSYSTDGCTPVTTRSVTGSSQVNGQCGYVTPAVITYGDCEAYGDGINIGSGTQCSGTYTQSYTDYRYNTRKKVYSDGVWDGTSYSTVGCGTTDSRVITGSSLVNGQCGHLDPVITYGPCEAYGSGTEIGSGNQCSGTYYQEYTDYRYNTRKKIYSDGVWDGSSYSTAGCGTTDSRTITSSSQVAGLCGVPVPCTISSYSEWSYSNITWSGNCPSGTESGTATSRSRTDNCGNTYNESGSYSVTRSCTVVETYGPCESYPYTAPVCNGEDSYVGNFTGYRKTSNLGNTTTAGCPSAVFNGYGECIARNVSSCGGSGGSGSTCNPPCSSLSGSPCGYNNTGTYDCNGNCQGASQPPSNQWYCTTSVNGGGVGNCEYTMPGYDNSASGSGYSRQCVYGTSYPACQSTNPAPVCTSYKYQCKSYDVTNPASNNYYTCYTVGECAANNNSDGSRASCCASYA